MQNLGTPGLSVTEGQTLSTLAETELTNLASGFLSAVSAGLPSLSCPSGSLSWDSSERCWTVRRQRQDRTEETDWTGLRGTEEWGSSEEGGHLGQTETQGNGWIERRRGEGEVRFFPVSLSSLVSSLDAAVRLYQSPVSPSASGFVEGGHQGGEATLSVPTAALHGSCGDTASHAVFSSSAPTAATVSPVSPHMPSDRASASSSPIVGDGPPSDGSLLHHQSPGVIEEPMGVTMESRADVPMASEEENHSAAASCTALVPLPVAQSAEDETRGLTAGTSSAVRSTLSHLALAKVPVEQLKFLKGQQQQKENPQTPTITYPYHQQQQLALEDVQMVTPAEPPLPSFPPQPVRSPLAPHSCAIIPSPVPAWAHGGVPCTAPKPISESDHRSLSSSDSRLSPTGERRKRKTAFSSEAAKSVKQEVERCLSFGIMRTPPVNPEAQRLLAASLGWSPEVKVALEVSITETPGTEKITGIYWDSKQKVWRAELPLGDRVLRRRFMPVDLDDVSRAFLRAIQWKEALRVSHRLSEGERNELLKHTHVRLRPSLTPPLPPATGDDPSASASAASSAAVGRGQKRSRRQTTNTRGKQQEGGEDGGSLSCQATASLAQLQIASSPSREGTDWTALPSRLPSSSMEIASTALALRAPQGEETEGERHERRQQKRQRRAARVLRGEHPSDTDTDRSFNHSSVSSTSSSISSWASSPPRYQVQRASLGLHGGMETLGNAGASSQSQGTKPTGDGLWAFPLPRSPASSDWLTISFHRSAANSGSPGKHSPPRSPCSSEGRTSSVTPSQSPSVTSGGRRSGGKPPKSPPSDGSKVKRTPGRKRSSGSGRKGIGQQSTADRERERGSRTTTALPSLIPPLPCLSTSASSSSTGSSASASSPQQLFPLVPIPAQALIPRSPGFTPFTTVPQASGQVPPFTHFPSPQQPQNPNPFLAPTTQQRPVAPAPLSTWLPSTPQVHSTSLTAFSPYPSQQSHLSLQAAAASQTGATRYAFMPHQGPPPQFIQQGGHGHAGDALMGVHGGDRHRDTRSDDADIGCSSSVGAVSDHEEDSVHEGDAESHAAQQRAPPLHPSFHPHSQMQQQQMQQQPMQAAAAWGLPLPARASPHSSAVRAAGHVRTATRSTDAQSMLSIPRSHSSHASSGGGEGDVGTVRHVHAHAHHGGMNGQVGHQHGGFAVGVAPRRHDQTPMCAPLPDPDHEEFCQEGGGGTPLAEMDEEEDGEGSGGGSGGSFGGGSGGFFLPQGSAGF